MVMIQRLLMAGLILIGIGFVIGCSDDGSDPGAPPPSPQSNDLQLQTINTSLDSPVFMTAPPGDSTRHFIAQQGGSIRIFDIAGGSALTDPFLNVSSLLSTGGERGLLGMAFDPQYATNRRFYIFYTNTAGNVVIARYPRDATDANLADSASATPLLTVAHPTFENHNGGMLVFGPDGCLYAGIGDGGGSGDPSNNGQNPSSLLGKLLRLNPDTRGVCTNVINNPFVPGGAQFQADHATHTTIVHGVFKAFFSETKTSPLLKAALRAAGVTR